MTEVYIQTVISARCDAIQGCPEQHVSQVRTITGLIAEELDVEVQFAAKFLIHIERIVVSTLPSQRRDSCLRADRKVVPDLRSRFT